MWLTPGTPAAGQSVKLVALFHNGETQSLAGTVMFYDGNTFLGQKKVTITPDGVGLANVMFTITAGTHQFSAAMSSVTEIAPDGSTIPYTTPLQTAYLSKVVVSAAPVASVGLSSASSGTASAFGSSIASGPNALLTAVSGYETSALSVVPVTLQDTVASAVAGVDSWRATAAATFTAQKAQAQAETKPLGVNAATGTLSKNPLPSSQVDGPIAYIKLALFTILSFIFSVSVIFYLLGIILAYIVIRFIVRKVAKFVRDRKTTQYKNSFPKAPKY